MRFLPVFLLLFMHLNSIGQQINGKVTDEAGIPLADATINLFRSTDSILLHTAISKTNGTFSFNKIIPGNYLLRITHVGFTDMRSQKITASGIIINLSPFILYKKEGKMADVVLTSKRPAIEVKADKVIFNVENNIAVNGLDGIELLRQSPGVLIDQEDNISIAGKSSVQIYIDGKPSPITGKDLSDYLRSLRSTAIESIEIINNPSAKYEAAGTGGIINIRLKKSKSFGTNGSVNYDFQQAIWSKHNAGFSLNNRSKKVNIFSNYNYTNATNEFDLDVYREVLDSIFDSYGATITRYRSHNVKAGVDYFINKSSTLGFMLNGNFSRDSTRGDNSSFISYLPSGKMNRLLISDNRAFSTRNTINLNLNYRYADAGGHELNMDADYGNYRLRSDQFQPNVFYDSMNTFLYQNLYTMRTPSDIDIYTFKVDYEQNLGKGKLGMGGKTAFVHSDNMFNFYTHGVDNKLLYDSVLSNHFIYKENINALYVNYNRSFKYLQIQAGLRGEQTITDGRSVGFTKDLNNQFDEYDVSFSRKRIDFFPSAAITFTKHPKSQWTLSYRRSINRPSYQDLNPFEKRSSEYGGFKGNPNLRPEYANSFSIIHVFHSKLVTNLSYGHTRDVIVSISDTLNGTKSFYAPKNLATQDNVSLSINYNWTKKWYAVSGSFTGFYTRNLADFGPGRMVDLNIFAYRLSAQNTFNLGREWTASLSGTYNSASIFRGTMKVHSLKGVNTGIQKTILDKRGTIRVNFNDVFNTMHWYGTSNFAGQYLNARVYWEPRRVVIGFGYKFGNSQVKSAQQRKSGQDEESRRTNDNSSGN